MERAVEMNHQRADLGGVLGAFLSVGAGGERIGYGLGHRFILYALGIIEPLQRRPLLLLFLLPVSLLFVSLLLMRHHGLRMTIAHGFGESFEVIIHRAGEFGSDQLSFRLGIGSRGVEPFS